MDTKELFTLVKNLISSNVVSDNRRYAIELLEEARIAHPHNTAILYKLAHICALDGQFEHAENLLPETDQDWAALRQRLDIYDLWIRAKAVPAVWARLDVLMERFGVQAGFAATPTHRDSLGNYTKFKRIVGLYIEYARYRKAVELLRTYKTSLPDHARWMTCLAQQIEFVTGFLPPTLSEASAAPTHAFPRTLRTFDPECTLLQAYTDRIIRKIEDIPNGRASVSGSGHAHPDKFLYARAMWQFIHGTPAHAIASLRPVFSQNIFDYFTIVLCLASSDHESTAGNHLVLETGATAYGELQRIASHLSQHKDVIRNVTRACTAPRHRQLPRLER